MFAVKSVCLEICSCPLEYATILDSIKFTLDFEHHGTGCFFAIVLPVCFDQLKRGSDCSPKRIATHLQNEAHQLQ